LVLAKRKEISGMSVAPAPGSGPAR
jgi:hypothetical protein